MADNTDQPSIKQPQLYDPKTGAPVSIPIEDIPSAVAAGKAGFLKGESIPVINEHGKVVTVSGEEAPLAFSQGYKYEPLDSQQGRADQAEYGEGAGSALKALAAGAARGVTLGASDAALVGSGLVNPNTLEKLKQYQPGASNVGEYGSMLLAGALTGGASAGAEGAAAAGAAAGEGGLVQGAAKLLPSNLVSSLGSKIAESGIAGRMGAGAAGLAEKAGLGALPQKILASAVPAAAGSAVEGAFYGAGAQLSDTMLGDPDKSAGNILANMGIGGLIGAPVGGVIGAGVGAFMSAKPALQGLIDKGSDVAKDAAKKVLSAFGGVSEADIDKYLLKSADVNAAPGFDEIYQHGLDHIQGLADDVSSKKLTAEQAEGNFRRLESDMKQDLREKGFDASVADKMAKKALKDAQESLLDSIQKDAIKQAEPIAQAAEALRQKVVDGSAESFEVLAQHPDDISLRGFIQKGRLLAGELESKGTLEAKSQAERLNQYLDGIKTDVGTSVRPAQAKLLIQGLDDVSKYDFNASAFDKGLSKYYKQLRHHLDDTLKGEVDAYKKAMAPVAEDTRLLRALEDYGTPEDAARRIKSLHLPDRYQSEMPLLRKLEEKTGTKFLEPVEKYANPEIRDQMAKALPQYHEAERSNAILEQLRDPRTKQALEETLRNSPEYQKYQDASAAHDFARSEQKKFGGLTASSLQGMLNSTMKGTRIHAERLVSQLPEFQGKSIPEVLSLLKTQQAFEKGAKHGSRNVNLYAGLLGAVGGAVQGEDPLHGALEGAGLGAGFGGMVDHYGPKMVKKALDAYIRLSNIEKINAGVTQAITSNVKAFVSPKAIQGSKAASVDYIIHNRMDKPGQDRSKKQKAEAYAKRFKEVSDAVANPSALAENISNNVGSLNDVAPNIANHLSIKASQAAQFLYDKAPKDPNAGYSIMAHKRPYQPSDADVAKWERYATAVDHPLTLLHDLKNGTVTREGVEAVQTVYPALYREMTQSLVEALSDGKHDLPYQKRLQLSTFFGSPVDASGAPDFVAYMQALHATKPQSNQEQGGLSAAKAKNVQFAENQKTDSESLNTRA